MVDPILQFFVSTNDPLLHDKLVLLLDWNVRNPVPCSSDQMNIAPCSIYLYLTYSFADVLPGIYKFTLAKQYFLKYQTAVNFVKSRNLSADVTNVTN